MPAKIQIIITDPSGLVADRSAVISDTEWPLLVKFHDGWPHRQLPNPAYDPDLEEDPENPDANPETVDVSDRWHMVEQLQSHLERGYRSTAESMVSDASKKQLESQIEAARTNLSVIDGGDVE